MIKIQSYSLIVKSFCLFIFILGSIIPLSTTTIEIDASKTHIFESHNFKTKGDYYDVYLSEIHFDKTMRDTLDSHILSAYEDFEDSPSEISRKLIFTTWLLGIILIIGSSLMTIFNLEFRIFKKIQINDSTLVLSSFVSLLVNHLLLYARFMISHDESVETSFGVFYIRKSTNLHAMFFLSGIAVATLGLLPIVRKKIESRINYSDIN